GMDHNFELEIEARGIELGIDTIIPLGLLINECFTNSLKYGYKDQSEGVLYVNVKVLDASNLILKIGDYGVGYTSAINHRTSNSLGLKIIQKLSIQLSGKIEKDVSKKGTHYILNFKLI
ncbi:MAG: two-component sensor histidine kinase, partial [Aureispira sp.]